MTILSNEIFSTQLQTSHKVRLVKPYPITHRFVANGDFAGNTLLAMMSEKFPFLNEDEWNRRIDLGRVYINGTKVEAGTMVKQGDEIFHHNPRVVEPSVPDEVEVLQEEEEYLIVYKPAPMPMHPGGRYNKNSLTEILKEEGHTDIRITHRLDAVTSGVLLLARTKDFAKKATWCFTHGKVEKTYLAHVHGLPEEDSVTIDSPIKRKHGFVFESSHGLTGAREAVTHFEVVERRENSAVVKCQPQTGRTHQIRLHLAHWGYPIIDDPIYGPDGDRSSRTMQKRGISLISFGLVIKELGIDYTLEHNFGF